MIRFANPNPKRCKESVRVVLSENENGCFGFAGLENRREWMTEV